MRRLGVILAFSLMPAVAGAQDAAPPTPDQAQRTAQALETCFQCHGAGGVSVIPTRPTIAGQKEAYVARQLRAFRKAAQQHIPQSDGDADDALADAKANAQPSRSDPIMEHMAQGLDDALIDSVARAVTQLPCDGKTDGNKNENKNGGGQAASSPPPAPDVANRCVSCHGANGIGTQAHVPNLAGQRRAYLRRQLLLIRETAFGAEPREGERWRSHPIMERQAGRLSIAEVDALAAYYAALSCRG